MRLREMIHRRRKHLVFGGILYLTVCLCLWVAVYQLYGNEGECDYDKYTAPTGSFSVSSEVVMGPTIRVGVRIRAKATTESCYRNSVTLQKIRAWHQKNRSRFWMEAHITWTMVKQQQISTRML